jgi:hypothetical protein
LNLADEDSRAGVAMLFRITSRNPGYQIELELNLEFTGGSLGANRAFFKSPSDFG